MKRLFSISNIVFLLIILFSMKTSAFMEIPSLYRGVRPLGMGNTYIAISDDESASFYNPAGLRNFKRRWHVELINPQVSLSTNSINIYDRVSNNKVDFNNESEVTKLLKDIAKKYQYVNAALFPNVTTGYFQIGYISNATAKLFVGAKGATQLGVDTDIVYDSGPVITGAYSFFRNRLRFGLSAKILERKFTKEYYTPAEIAADDFDILKNSETVYHGTAIDFGIQSEFKTHWKPTVGLVIKNIGDVKFTEDNRLSQQIDFGLAMYPIKKRTRKLLMAIDYVDITNNASEDKDVYKRLHLGTEFSWKFLALRTGINQGYLTYGLGLNWRFFQMNYAFYSEEMGAFAGQYIDSRHVLKLSFGF